MDDIRTHLDAPSLVVILVTFVLFAAALFVKGIGHDLLLEAGVFLVSVKLIIMAYKSSVATSALSARLDSMQQTLIRIESSVRVPGGAEPVKAVSGSADSRS